MFPDERVNTASAHSLSADKKCLFPQNPTNSRFNDKLQKKVGRN